MAKVYASLCEKGVRNFFTVPANLQDDVRAIIEADGYQINEDGTVTKVPVDTISEEEIEATETESEEEENENESSDN